ncbi:MAG: hypothetical protein KDB21_03740 [Acidimicrobiales bacterium]|nr:hypothetical protein [Acidimicrobiales bacterium]
MRRTLDRTVRRILATGAATAVVAALVAACGGGAGPGDAPDTAPPPAATAPEATSSAEPTVSPSPTPEPTEPAGDVAVDALWRPWHPDGGTASPDVALEQFLAFSGLGDDATVGEFEPSDDGGRFVLETGVVGEGVDPFTTVTLASDDDGHWWVTGAASDIVDVVLPAAGASVSSPLVVRFEHNTFAAREAALGLWVDDFDEAVASISPATSGSGVFASGAHDVLVTWPPDVHGPATVIVTSVGERTLAVTTVRLELVDDATAASPEPVPDTMLGPIGDQRRAILYQPGVSLSVHEPGPCGDAPRPALVTGGPQSLVFVEGFVARGYVVLDVDWRTPGLTTAMSPGSVRAAVWSVNDLGLAVRWLRAHADELCVDSERIGTVGYSFGAITALSQAYSAGDVDLGEVSIPTLGDPVELPEDRPTPPVELLAWPDDVGAVVAFAGFALVGAVDAGEPPALMFAGENDQQIPIALPQQTCADAVEAGVTCELVVHDAGHAIAADVEAALDRADRFLQRELAATTRSPSEADN